MSPYNSEQMSKLMLQFEIKYFYSSTVKSNLNIERY